MSRYLQTVGGVGDLTAVELESLSLDEQYEECFTENFSPQIGYDEATLLMYEALCRVTPEQWQAAQTWRPSSRA